jgi:hypothetical protein
VSNYYVTFCSSEYGDVKQNVFGFYDVEAKVDVSSVTEKQTCVQNIACEAWSLTLREEHRLRVFENRVLRRIFVPKRDEVAEEWRKLHNEELHS